MSSRLVEMKKWLLDKGMTQADIARKAGVSNMSIHLVLKGFMRSRRIEAILRELGCPEDLLERKVA
jgi:transcriptional regulator with XRE-family HTH domain